MPPRPSTYKPLLFSTTIRNPERWKRFLRILKRCEGKILSDQLAVQIAGEIISSGVYIPNKTPSKIKEKIKNSESLSNAEVARVLAENPQRHKEAGFAGGWASRFDTWFKLAKVFGFVFYRNGAAIRFSELGERLVDSADDEKTGNIKRATFFEQPAFLHALAKFQRNNPFLRSLNENAPLILLLQVINRLKSEEETTDAGITRLEVPLILFWKNADATALCRRIVQLRREHGYSPSQEVIIDICQNEIMQGRDVKRNINSFMRDYVDEFIRKMRLTGLVSLRGGGRFIDVNQNEAERANYILTNYAAYQKYDTEEAYFEYASTIDENLLATPVAPVQISDRERFLETWVSQYTWNEIKHEMKVLVRRHQSKDGVLRYISQPIRLEFLTALAVKSQFPAVRVIPNYPVDDEGIPTSTAAGTNDTGDIECIEKRDGVLLEVTMSEGRTQTMMEVWPISRHLTKFQETHENAMCYFIAPSMFTDTLRQIRFLHQEEGQLVVPKTISEFLEYLESNATLYR